MAQWRRAWGTRSDCRRPRSVHRVGDRHLRADLWVTHGSGRTSGERPREEHHGQRSRDRARAAATRPRSGARLRSIRRQKHLSLQDVEAASEHEFKASVLGAYERGERAISVPRLQRLARFYRVPVDQMLPSDDELGIRSATGDEHVVDLTERLRGSRPRRPARHDRPGRRRAAGRAGGRDARPLPADDPGAAAATTTDACSRSGARTCAAVACILDCHPDQVPARLDSLGLCLVR